MAVALLTWLESTCVRFGRLVRPQGGYLESTSNANDFLKKNLHMERITPMRYDEATGGV